MPRLAFTTEPHLRSARTIGIAIANQTLDAAAEVDAALEKARLNRQPLFNSCATEACIAVDRLNHGSISSRNEKCRNSADIGSARLMALVGGNIIRRAAKSELSPRRA